MSVEATSETMRSYLDALLARGDFADYFTDDVTWTTIGTGQELQGRQPVRNFLTWMHTQAFDAQPKVKTPVVGDGQAALEADFVGTHTDEFGSFAKAVHERHPSTLAVAGPERADDHAAPSQEREPEVRVRRPDGDDCSHDGQCHAGRRERHCGRGPIDVAADAVVGDRAGYRGGSIDKAGSPRGCCRGGDDDGPGTRRRHMRGNEQDNDEPINDDGAPPRKSASDAA